MKKLITVTLLILASINANAAPGDQINVAMKAQTTMLQAPDPSHALDGLRYCRKLNLREIQTVLPGSPADYTHCVSFNNGMIWDNADLFYGSKAIPVHVYRFEAGKLLVAKNGNWELSEYTVQPHRIFYHIRVANHRVESKELPLVPKN